MTSRPEQDAGITYAEVGIHFRRDPARQRNPKTMCPVCHGTRRNQSDESLSVDYDKGSWKCHHCGWRSGLGQEARERGVAPEQRTPRPTPPPSAGKHLPPSDYQGPRPMPPELEPWAREWLHARGLSDPTLEAYGVRSKSVQTKEGKTLQVVYLPYTIDGELVNIKRRILPKNWLQEPGAPRSLFALDHVPEEARELVIVEGEFDVLAIAELGLGWAAVSLPDGAPNAGDSATGKLAALEEPKAEHVFSQAERILIATDMDSSGHELATALAEKLGYSRCFRVSWPEGCKDANATLLAHGPEGVEEALAGARPIPLPGVTRFRDIGVQLHRLYQRGLPPGYSTGIAALDPLYTPAPGGITVVAGIPSHGKSTWIDNILVHYASTVNGAPGWKFGICTPERQPPELHASQLLQIAHRRPFRSGLDALPEGALDVGLDWLDEHFFGLSYEEPTVESILATTAELVHKYGVNGLVIDPWAQLESNRPDRKTETEYVAQTLREIRRFNTRHQIHTWIVLHPSSMKDLIGKNGKLTVPTGYHCAGSSHWYNLSDHGVTIFRDMADKAGIGEDGTRLADKTLFKVWKNRWAHLGSIGEAWMSFDPRTTRYGTADATPMTDQAERTARVESPDAEELVHTYANTATATAGDGGAFEDLAELRAKPAGGNGPHTNGNGRH